MEKIKKFINKRSKLGLLVFLVSIVISVLLILEITNYSEYISLVTDPVNTDLVWHSPILQVLSNNVFISANVLVCSILIFISLYNIVGYIYNNSEFMFISTGLYIVLFCISMYIFEISGVIFIASLLLLNLLGYIDQIKITNKKSKTN